MSLINHNYSTQLRGDAALDYDTIIQHDFRGEITLLQAAVTLQPVSIVLMSSTTNNVAETSREPIGWRLERFFPSRI